MQIRSLRLPACYCFNQPHPLVLMQALKQMVLKRQAMSSCALAGLPHQTSACKSASSCLRDRASQADPLPRTSAHTFASGTNIHVQILITLSQNLDSSNIKWVDAPEFFRSNGFPNTTAHQIQPRSLLTTDPWAQPRHTESESLVIGPNNLCFCKTFFILFHSWSKGRDSGPTVLELFRTLQSLIKAFKSLLEKQKTKNTTQSVVTVLPGIRRGPRGEQQFAPDTAVQGHSQHLVSQL